MYMAINYEISNIKSRIKDMRATMQKVKMVYGGVNMLMFWH